MGSVVYTMDYLTSLPISVYWDFLFFRDWNGNGNVLQRLSGKIYFLPLPCSVGCQHSLACGCITLVSSSTFTHLLLSCVVKSPSPPFLQDTCECLGPALTMQDDPVSRSSNQSHLQRPCFYMR